MRKTFKYRLFPTAAQQELPRVQLSEACACITRHCKNVVTHIKRTRNH